jgi:very-short-patch-repair endonuclease
MMNRPEILKFLADHHWVASLDQLRELEVSKAALQHARRVGVLDTPLRGIVSLAAVDLSFEGRAMVIQLAAGDTSFVSGPSAGVLYRLRMMPRTPIEVAVKEDHQLTLPPWGRLVRTSWIDEERDVVTRPDGLRVASPLRMLFGLARRFNQYRFERAAEDVWHRKLATPDDAAAYLAAVRRSGRHGVTRFEKWLEKTVTRPRPSQSGLELDFVDLLDCVGLPKPERQHPLVLSTGEEIHLDLAWPDVRLAVEPGHSWWHGGDLRMRVDYARDRACDEIGWRVIRYDEAAAEDPERTARQILAIYQRRKADLANSAVTLDR